MMWLRGSRAALYRATGISSAIASLIRFASGKTLVYCGGGESSCRRRLTDRRRQVQRPASSDAAQRSVCVCAVRVLDVAEGGDSRAAEQRWAAAQASTERGDSRLTIHHPRPPSPGHTSARQYFEGMSRIRPGRRAQSGSSSITRPSSATGCWRDPQAEMRLQGSG